MSRSVPLSLSINHLFVTLGSGLVFGLSFRLGLGLLFVPSRRRVWRTFYDLCCTYFLPEVMMKFARKAKGHFAMLIEVGMHLIECISGHNSHWPFVTRKSYVLGTSSLLSFSMET